MSYNLTFMDNSTSIMTVIDGLNTASGNIVGIFIILIVWVGLLAGTRSYDFQTRFLVTNFITLVISALLWFAGFVSWLAVAPLVALTMISIIIYYYQ